MAFTIGSEISVASAVTTTSTTTGVSIAAAMPDRTLGVKIVVVGTPTVAASFIVQVSFDGGTDYYDHTGATGPGALAAGTYTWTVPLPASATHVRLAFTAQTGGTSSTLDAEAGNITSY